MAEKFEMGIGRIGQPDIIFKRKFRFTFEISGFCNNAKNRVPKHFVRTASRPQLDIEETEINHLNATTWIPSKAKWQEMTVTYLDVATEDMRPMWNWLATIYDFTDPIRLRQGIKRDWDATGLLTLYDGCGVVLEAWQLLHMWPKAINFQDLDYGSADPAEIELTLRYSDVKYRSFCPNFIPQGCCSGCPAPRGSGNNTDEPIDTLLFGNTFAGTGVSGGF